MQERETKAGSQPEVEARARVTPIVGGSAGQLLALQRRGGNRAVVASLGRSVQRRVDAADTTADPDMGPVAAIEDSAVTGTAKANADDALAKARAGTAFEALPWVAARAAANGGKVPNSVKKNFKWAWPHRNRDGHLPGKKGAGGYLEYYIRTGLDDAAGPSDYERLCISTSDSKVFHTATHYGDQGAPAFTQYA